jgi:hypothetical protein
MLAQLANGAQSGSPSTMSSHPINRDAAK